VSEKDSEGEVKSCTFLNYLSLSLSSLMKAKKRGSKNQKIHIYIYIYIYIYICTCQCKVFICYFNYNLPLDIHKIPYSNLGFSPHFMVKGISTYTNFIKKYFPQIASGLPGSFSFSMIKKRLRLMCKHMKFNSDTESVAKHE
jgi:hypothetical protein